MITMMFAIILAAYIEERSNSCLIFFMANINKEATHNKLESIIEMNPLMPLAQEHHNFR